MKSATALLDQAQRGAASADADALFKEAKQRRRRRRLVWLGLVRAQGDRLVTSFSFGKVPGISTFVFLQYFAVSPNGTLYADDLGPPAFELYQQIVSVDHGHGTSLWRGRNRRVHPPPKSSRQSSGG